MVYCWNIEPSEEPINPFAYQRRFKRRYSLPLQASWILYSACSPRREAAVAARPVRASSINWLRTCCASCPCSIMRTRCERIWHAWAFCCPWTSSSGRFQVDICPVWDLHECLNRWQAGDWSHAARHQARSHVSLWSEAGHRWHHRNESGLEGITGCHVRCPHTRDLDEGNKKPIYN